MGFPQFGHIGILDADLVGIRFAPLPYRRERYRSLSHRRLTPGPLPMIIEHALY
jgi:hypothetical protein